MAKVKINADLASYGLQSQVFYPIPPEEICELHYYGDEISGDGRGLS